ncbi:MAG: N-6 DNA methylase [Candidatus Heimdallarchaeota archaeon]|nr:MAG: N-6 DNA methylase [Candidatus Heimdallarchaeota archaeon]
MKRISNTSRKLSKTLAQAAINIRENIKLHFPKERENGHLHQIFQDFREVIQQDLTLDSFADIYAQTVIYGLFFVRTTHQGRFHINKAPNLIPNSSPFLESFFNKIFRFKDNQLSKIYLEDLGINKLEKILNSTEIESIIDDSNKSKDIEDPFFHFYENFLNYYNPHQKARCGVFYTPKPIVSFIVRSVDQLLRQYFDYDHGLADESVSNRYQVEILDPATGTGTFLFHIIDLVFELYKKKYSSLDKDLFQQNWNNYVSQNLLTRLYGFELLMAPYTVAHLKLGLKLQKTGFHFNEQERIGVYLTNTLKRNHQTESISTKVYPNTNLLTTEDELASNIKKSKHISVVLGNPPYSGHSANKTQWIDDLLRGKIAESGSKINYFEVDGKPLTEKNPKFLNDDYVKFIRFGQWWIEKTGYGILAFITNHSFLDNPTFRGMRQQLTKTFDRIYILDLHGNTRRKERCPDGSKDENVFDIQQGVCISFFIKQQDGNKRAKIYKADIWGLRNEKYEFLNNNDVSTINWEQIDSFRPWYMFYQLNMNQWKEYRNGWIITNIFREGNYSVGIMTGQDRLAIKYSPEEIQEAIIDLVTLSESDLRRIHSLPEGKRQWTREKAIDDLEEFGVTENMDKREIRRKVKSNLVPILYRPFDTRYTFYTGKSCGFHERPRGKIMRHMTTGDNLGIIVSRNSRPAPWRDVQITKNIIELGVMATRPGNNAPIFPLFIYKVTKNGIKKESNFSDKFQVFLKKEYSSKKKPTSKDVLYYIYAILHSHNYRKRYEEFLKVDFPRIHFTSNIDLFYELKQLGKELIDLHLMRSTKTINFSIKLKVTDSTKPILISNLVYTNDGKLQLNKTHHFEGVPENVYNFYIGSYKVCQKWLKSRRNKVLTKKEISHFSKMVETIQETISIMNEIDNAIEEHGGWPSALIAPT